MLRYKTELDLVQSPCTTSGQETERVYSYNPGTRTGLLDYSLIRETSGSVSRWLRCAIWPTVTALQWTGYTVYGMEMSTPLCSVRYMAYLHLYLTAIPTPPHLRRVRITSIRKNWTEIEGNTWHGAPEKVPLKSRGQDVPQGAQTVKMLNYVYFFTHVRPVTRVIPVAAKTLMPAFSLLSLHRTIR